VDVQNKGEKFLNRTVIFPSNKTIFYYRAKYPLSRGDVVASNLKLTPPKLQVAGTSLGSIALLATNGFLGDLLQFTHTIGDYWNFSANLYTIFFKLFKKSLIHDMSPVACTIGRLKCN
jgi:hypothetical protein